MLPERRRPRPPRREPPQPRRLPEIDARQPRPPRADLDIAAPLERRGQPQRVGDGRERDAVARVGGRHEVAARRVGEAEVGLGEDEQAVHDADAADQPAPLGRRHGDVDEPPPVLFGHRADLEIVTRERVGVRRRRETLPVEFDGVGEVKIGDGVGRGVREGLTLGYAAAGDDLFAPARRRPPVHVRERLGEPDERGLGLPIALPVEREPGVGLGRVRPEFAAELGLSAQHAPHDPDGGVLVRDFELAELHAVRPQPKRSADDPALGLAAGNLDALRHVPHEPDDDGRG